MRATFVFFVLSVGLVSGQATSPEERQETLAYQLTLPRANQLIAAMEAMTKYVVSLPDFQDRVIKSMNMTPAERRAQLEKDPKAMAIVKQNGLTAHGASHGADGGAGWRQRTWHHCVSRQCGVRQS